METKQVMKRFCLRILMLTPLLFSVLSSYAKQNSISLDLCPVDTIVISKNAGSEVGEGPKSATIIPIVCTLSDSGTNLEFCFLDDLGFVTVTLMNLSTGEIESGVLDSQLGIVDFTFSGDSGFYLIMITTSSGLYQGNFII